MHNFIRNARVGSILLMFAVCAGFFIGCQQVKNGASTMVSTLGIKAETLLPHDALMVFKIGTSDKIQLENLQKILANFPKEGVDYFFKSLISDFDKQLEKDDLSIEKDFMPVIGQNLQMMVGIIGKFGDKSPDMLVVVPLADVAKADLIFDKLSIKGEYQKTIYKDYPIYAKTDTYVGRYKDLLLISNQIELIQRGIEKANSNDTLLQSDRYQKAVSKIGQAMGFFYMDTKQFFAQLNENAKTSESTQQTFADSKAIKNTEGEVFSFYAEPQGIRLKIYVYASQDAGFMDAPMHEPYLYKNVQDPGTFLYTEFYNLKKILEINGKTFENVPGFNEMASNLRLGLALQGIDLDKDLLSFLDKGISLQIHGTGGLIPGLGINIDVSSNPESARKILKKIYELISAYTMTVNQDGATYLINETIKHGAELPGSIDSGAYRLVLRLPNEQLPAPLQGDKEFDYELNNNILSFKLNPSSKAELPWLSENKEFNQSRELIKGFDQGITYLEVAPLMDYIAKVAEFAQFGSYATPEDFQIIEAVKVYFAPVKSLVFASGKPSATEVEMQGFLHIENF